MRLKTGDPLSWVTVDLCRAFGGGVLILPPTDDRVRTIVETPGGPLDFQTYFVRNRCEPVITGLRYEGASEAALLPAVITALEDPELKAVILCPSNPFLSLDPILATADLRNRLRRCKAPVVAVSPMIGSRAFKGPTAKIMAELGYEVSALSIARYYADFLDGYVIDGADHHVSPQIEDLDIRVEVTATLMETLDQKFSLAADVVAFSETMLGVPLS